MLTQDQLHAIMPQLSRSKGTAFFPFLSAAISEFGIDTPERAAAFLAQLAHESGQLPTWSRRPPSRKSRAASTAVSTGSRTASTSTRSRRMCST